MLGFKLLNFEALMRKWESFFDKFIWANPRATRSSSVLLIVLPNEEAKKFLNFIWTFLNSFPTWKFQAFPDFSFDLARGFSET